MYFSDIRKVHPGQRRSDNHQQRQQYIFFFASALLYSQAATAKALMPMALALNVSPLTAVASFAAVSGLFILPTYPTLVAAVQLAGLNTRNC